MFQGLSGSRGGFACFLYLCGRVPTIGSSGCAAQMVFIPPNTTTVVFIDNYHTNFGGPGVNLNTGAPSSKSYTYDDGTSVFSTEYSLQTNGLRRVKPLSNTFCSAGSFFADETLANVAGAEAGPASVAQDFNNIRTHAPGPCAGACTQDWIERSATLQHTRWYLTAQTLVDGSVLVVRGADVQIYLSFICDACTSSFGCSKLYS